MIDSGRKLVENLASNTILATVGHHNGLDGFIHDKSPGLYGNIIIRHKTDTIEAILATVYLDARRSIDIFKAVM